MRKHIFVTGGVVSSLGKGLTSAAVGALLEARGLKIGIQKLDPYINVDPGTMSPYQHGEVYVTRDGAETDLDLGHYERFTNAQITRASNYTTGQIYFSVITKERRGDYLGRTVQVIPHITDEIKGAIRSAEDDVDVLITEIGGTVGDIEGLPFLESIRQFALEKGRGNVTFIHLTLVPHLRVSGEMKTKPTQHSVGRLREIGIQPDFILCRTELPMGADLKEKISLFCNVERGCVIEEKDVDHSIYELPTMLHHQGLDGLICERLGLETREPDMRPWRDLVERIKTPAGEVEIAVAGKYIVLHDAYKSVYEALSHGGFANNVKVRLRKVNPEELSAANVAERLQGADGLVVPGGFGERGFEGKILAIKHARETKLPFLGLCLGLQAAVVEYARNVCGLKNAQSTEFTKDCTPVIDLMEAQKKVKDMGGTMRLGSYPCRVIDGTLARRLYGAPLVEERHRHRYEVNNAYRGALAEHGLVFSGVHDALDLVEIIELKDHPYFLATQFHPEFQSKPMQPHPVFRGLIAAAHARRGK
ncbi:MAG TPA: CTP synthase [Planctomycetota bacterium]|nr:CTP synthase [Planctomycetota bacterium]